MTAPALHEVTGTDLFCGLGGSSTGAVQIPGVRMVIAARLHGEPIEESLPAVNLSALDKLTAPDAVRAGAR